MELKERTKKKNKNKKQNKTRPRIQSAVRSSNFVLSFAICHHSNHTEITIAFVGDGPYM